MSGKKPMNKLNDREKLLHSFMEDNNVSILEIIDLVIKSNRLVGVGLVSLEDYIAQGIKKHHKDESLDKIMNG
jgi:hypothetical protein